MALATLLAITIMCIGWSLWIRRVTWTCRWEVAATLNIALQGAAVLLMSPLASETVGHWLHALTGKWNLEDYIGHDCYIVAASAIVYNTLGRLADDDAMQKSFKQYVERPATLCIPLLLVTFSIGNGARIYKPDFFTVPTDFWLNVYWLLLCGTLIYLLVYGIRATSCCARIRGPGGSPTSIWRLPSSASSRASCGSPSPLCLTCRQPWAATWSGCSPASAARGSRSRPRIRGG